MLDIGSSELDAGWSFVCLCFGVGILRLANTLDYDTVSSYSLTVQARDGGTPGHSANVRCLLLPIPSVMFMWRRDVQWYSFRYVCVCVRARACACVCVPRVFQ